MPEESTTYDAAMAAFSALESSADEPDIENQQDDASTPVDGGDQQPLDSQEDLPSSNTIDISQLPEEAQLYLRARERELTGDYTRKTQEVAEQRREAEQAIQFLQALNSDAQFARQVYDHLGSLFYGDEGPGAEPPVDEYTWDGDIGDEYALDEPFDDDDPYLREINELKAWKEQQEYAMLEAQASAYLDRQLAEIRSQSPDLTDEDMADILNIGYATGGDLFAAHNAFSAMRDRVLTSYLDRKGSVTAPSPLPSSPAQQVSGDELKTPEDLRAAALERIRTELGDS